MRSPNSDTTRNNIEEFDNSDCAIITISSSSSVFLGFANELDEEYYETEPNSAHSIATLREDIITINSDSNSGLSNSSDLELIDPTMRGKDMTSTEKVTNWQTFQYHYKNLVQKDTGNCNGVQMGAPRSPIISRTYIPNDLDKQNNTIYKKSILSNNSEGSNKSSVMRTNNANDSIPLESPKLNISPSHQKAMSSQSSCSPRSILPSPTSSMIQIRNSYMEAASNIKIQLRGSYLENDYSKIDDSQSNKESTNNIINNNRDRKEELLKYLGIDSKPHTKIPSEPENVNYAKRRSLRCLIEQSKINNILKGQPTNNSKYYDDKNNKKQQINSKMYQSIELKKNEKSLKSVEASEQKIKFKTPVQNEQTDVAPIEKVSEKLTEISNHNCVTNNEIKLLKIDLVSIPTVSMVQTDKDKKINGNNILDKKSYKVNKKIGRSNGAARFLIKKNSNRLVRSKTARVPLRNGKYRSTLSKTQTNDKNAASEKNIFSNKKKILQTCFNGNSKLFSNGAEKSRIHENAFKFKKKSSDVSSPTPSLCLSSSGISSASLPVTPKAEALQVTLNNPLVSADGYVLKAFYCKNNLVIVQEKAISFWSYSRISMIFGIKQNWEMLGRIKRVCNDLLIKNQSNNICYKDNKPVYVEFFGKETKNESRTSPFSSIYLNLYSLQSYDLNGNKLTKLQYQSIQMDGIWSCLADVCCTVISNFNLIFMSWYQKSKDDNRTGLCKYGLKVDMETFNSITVIEPIKYKLLSFQNLNDERLIGFGETLISIWDIHSCDILVFLDLKTPLGINLSCIEYNDDGKFLLLIQILEANAKDGRVVKLFAVDLNTFFWRILDNLNNLSFHQKVPLSSSNTSDLLITTFEDGEMCIISLNSFNILYSNLLSKKNKFSSRIFSFENYVINISDNDLNVKTVNEYLISVMTK